ncbi:glycoside hydrolase family 76 protein [Actinacidiphila rubida]|uniref:Glycosyl hydrolase family 76 n=2 Tax=Actinacidiphila rubida TaxID=310780 RepID=A0A1H8SJL3_9ACTN|nr:glycoside hydrolase family 76 protein [Actinacidiphila rubida]SEO78872.1 Glycosyl hydrolase family 76 [Actinacidiphila rubida]
MRSHRLQLALTGAAVAVLAAGTVSAASPDATARSADPGQRQSMAHANELRATATYASLEKYFGTNDGSGLFREQYPVAVGDNAYSYEWPLSQVHVAALDIAAVEPDYKKELTAVDRAQEHYWNPACGTTGVAGYDSYVIAPYGTGGDLFYDDNEWVGLEKVQDYLQHHDRAALSRAEQIFTLVRSGWDTDPSHAAPGGVFWTQAPWSQDRNTVSNMPAAELGLRLYQITGKRAYLDDAKRFYDWTNANLQSPSGLYWDHVNLGGDVEKTFWTYNQGVPIAVNVLLYKATHDRTYLTRAERIAEAAYSYYVTGDKLKNQPVYFNSIFFKNLLLLESVTGGNTYRQAMADYADWLWASTRDVTTGLVHLSTSGSTQSIEQAAAAQVFAVLAWPRTEWPALY